MATGDGYQVITQYAKEARVMGSSLIYRETSDIPPGQPCKDIADAFWTATSSEWKAIASDRIQYQCVYVRKLTGIPEPTGLHNISAGDGTEVGAAMPPNAAAVFSVPSGVGSTRNQNRMFFSGLSETSVNGNRLTQVAIDGIFADWVTAITAVIAVNGGDIELSVAAYNILGVPQVPPLIGPRTGAFWRGIIKNQRKRTSRLTGIGPT